jgi:hypothetical protein
MGKRGAWGLGGWRSGVANGVEGSAFLAVMLTLSSSVVDDDLILDLEGGDLPLLI